MAGPSPDGRLELGLATQHPARLARLVAGLGDHRQQRAQLAELSRQRGVVGRPRGALPERAGTAALGPLEHRVRAAGLQREPEPERRQRVAVDGGAGAQLRGADADAMRVEHGEPGPQRPQRAHAPARGQPSQRLGVPGREALRDRCIAAGVPHGLQIAGGLVLVAERERDARGQHPSVERLGGTSEPVERIGGTARAGEQRSVANPAGERGAHRDVLAQRRPRRPALGRELRGGLLGGGEGRRGVPARERCFGEGQAGLGELGRHRGRSEQLDGALGTAQRLLAQPGCQERAAAVEPHDRPQRLAGLGHHRLGGVEARQRVRKVPAQSCHQPEVVQGHRRAQRLVAVAGERFGVAQVGLGGAQRSAIDLDDAAVEEREDLGGNIARPACERQRDTVALQRLVEAAEPLEDQRVLLVQAPVAGRFLDRHREPGLAQRGGRPAGVLERVREAHARLRDAPAAAGTPRGGDRGPQLRHRLGSSFEVERGETEGAQCHRRRVLVAGRARRVERFLRERAGAMRIVAEQADRLVGEHRGVLRGRRRRRTQRQIVSQAVSTRRLSLRRQRRRSRP